MLDFFGWYEFITLCLIAGAYIHGTMSANASQLARGVELTLEHLEQAGFIKVDEKTGEVTKA